MKIIELVKHLISIEKAEAFVYREIPQIDYDLVDIYMINSLELESELFFFDAETIPNKLSIEIDNVNYENLFPLNLAQEIVEDIKRQYKNISDIDVAKKLLEYRKKDA